MGAEAGGLAMQLSFEADQRPQQQAEREATRQLEFKSKAELGGQRCASCASGRTCAAAPSSSDHHVETQT